MAVDDYHDVQICLWKMLKLSSKTCVNASINHPYISSSLFFSFLLYIFFPLVFWVLVYSTPVFVCSCIALNIRNMPREDAEGDTKIDQNYNTRKKAKFATERVHSVRRRRAKEIMREVETKQNAALQEEKEEIMRELDELAKQSTLLQQDEQTNFLLQQDKPEEEKEKEKEKEEEEENKVSSTNNCDDCVDKTALLVEETPKEIREVEQVHSSPKTFLNQENEETNEEDHKNNKMDIGISDTERTKRLESLIARRRSRKMMSIHVRNALMHKDKINNHTTNQITNLIIPKINTFSPNKISGPFSPGPGSAPSILIPMRNPFDLPYDPHEEKPDLTGDSFHQEFTSSNNYRDMMFSRHESFSLGPSLPGEYFRNRDTTSSGRDFGFRRRFSDYAGRGFSPIMEQKSYDTYESKSSINSPDGDQIKEVIQVDENDSEESNGESETTEQIPQSDFNTSVSSPSSSEDDPPLFKIDREAVLKSLSSMRRNALLELENNEEGLNENLSYANSALENAARLKQQYYEDKPMRRHTISYSIASDMQVEVSEISSPPLTIDENMNEDCETERNDPSWAGDQDSWGGRDSINDEASRIETTEDESLSDSTTEHDKHCVQSELSDNGEDGEPEQRVEDQQSPDDHASVTQLDANSNDTRVQSTTISPKSVLISTLSLLNLQEANEDGHQSTPHAPESSSLANASSESVNYELKIQENDEQSQETSSRSIDDSEATSSQNVFNKNIDQPKMVIREFTHDDERQTNSTSSNSSDETKQVQDYDLSEGNKTNKKAHQFAPHTVESSSPANMSPEDELKIQENDEPSGESSSRSIVATSAIHDSKATSNQNIQSDVQIVIREFAHDDEKQTNSTSSNSPDETKQVQDYDLSEPVEGNQTNEEAHQFAPHTAESLSHVNASPESINHELKIQEIGEQSGETSSISIDVASVIHDSEAASNKNDQSEMVIRESTHEDERQTNSTSSNPFNETKDYDLSELVEDNEMKRADHRDDELKFLENGHQSEETISRSIGATSTNDFEATSNQNAFNANIDQSKDQMVIRESTNEDERQTNSTSSNPLDGTIKVQDYDLRGPVEDNETNGADHRADEQHANSQGTVLLEIISSIHNDNK